jgi:Zn-dependent metalloprotease
MKKLLIFSVFALFSQILFSQIYKGSTAAEQVQGADMVRFEEFSKVPSYIHFRDDINLSIEKSLELTKQFMQGSNSSFIFKNVQKNKYGDQTHRYQQSYNGIPIEFSVWNIQFVNDRVFAMNGEILDNPQVNVQFSLTEEQALQSALDYVGAEFYMWQDAGEEALLKDFSKDENATYFPKAEKIIVPANVNFKNSELRTAYKFNIYSKKPYSRMNVYVDAISGEILFDMPLLQVADAVGTAQTQYSGTQSINTEYTGGQYILNDNTRASGIRTLNCEMGIDYDAAVEFVDADNNWNNVNANLDEYATDAHFATASTYDYYLNVHGRNSIDDGGYQLWSFVHFDLVEYGYGSNMNAFWNGQWMTYGDGTETITPLTTVDICGHEITHGLTSYTCNLNYQDESGAINEAFSDIFGTAIEYYAVPAYADWTIGEDIGQVFRSIQDPQSTSKPDTYHGTFWNFGTDDYGGVHTNGLALCYAFYLLSEGGTGTNDLSNNYTVNGIGMDKAEQIFFRLQTVYLTPNSDYHDAWFYCMQAASDLYGACSMEVKSVGDAFYAIGVAEPYVAETHAGFNALFTESCEPPFTVQFLNQSYNGDNFLWTFGDGATSTEINPVHTYTINGFFDVQLEVDGTACGSDIELINDFIVVDPSIPCLTLMPETGNSLITECSGIIYDAGGPTANYYDNNDGSITLFASGSDQIVLTIEELNIEAGSGTDCDYDYLAFYDGSSTSASLINSTYYCNTNGNPGTISSTGEYITIRFVSDGGLNMSGFKILFDCVGGENPPTPYFSSNKQYTCDGEIEFSDNSLNSPTSWYWNFGDGNSSTQQNPVHVYSTSGVYTVSLSVTNAFGNQELVKTDYITVALPDAPVVEDVVACQDMNFPINQLSDGITYWYETEDAETPIHIGNYWDHPALAAPVTYYLNEVFAGSTSYVGETENENGGGYFGNPDFIHYLVFDAYTPFLLESIEVNAEGDGNRTIALRNSTMEIISQKVVYCPDGVSRVTVNIDVPIGTNLQLVGMGTPNLWRTNDAAFANFPYTVTDVMSITRSSAGANPLDYYYYFYDWQVSTPDCVSPFSSLNLIPEICTGIKQNFTVNDISISPNPSNGLFFVNNPSGLNYSVEITEITGKLVAGKFNTDNESIDLTYLADGVYFVRFKTDDGQNVLKLVKN